MYKVECLYVSDSICLLPIHSAPLHSTHTLKHIRNRNESGNAAERIHPSRRPSVSQILTSNNYRLTYMFAFCILLGIKL